MMTFPIALGPCLPPEPCYIDRPCLSAWQLQQISDGGLFQLIAWRLAERANEPHDGYYESCDYLNQLNGERDRRAAMTAHARITERRKVAMLRAAEVAGRRVV